MPHHLDAQTLISEIQYYVHMPECSMSEEYRPLNSICSGQFPMISSKDNILGMATLGVCDS